MHLLPALLLACAATSAAAMAPAEIDRYFQERWKAKGLTPSAAVSDTLFLRRIWLDAAGTVPPVNDLLAFEADRDPAKRLAAIDRLLARREYAEAWADRFRTLLLDEAKMTQQRRLTRPFDRWLAQAFAENMRYDKMARLLVAGRGPTQENPEASYVAQFKDSPEALTGHMARTFMGVQIQCAQCHDHPFEKWTQREFYGLHAFFARTKGMQIPAAGLEALRAGRFDELAAMAGKKKNANGPGNGRRKARVLERMMSDMPPPSLSAESRMEMAFARGPMPARAFVVFDRPRGEAVMPDPKAPPPAKREQPAGETIRPRFLDGTEPAWPDTGVNRRELLAAWMTAPGNPYFAPALVNRVWAMLVGRGLVTPIDNVANPDDKTHAALLARLGAHFAQSGFDLKGLFRLIASTQVYQLAIEPSPDNAKDKTEFSRGATRPLDPEQLFRSLMQASGLDAMLQARDPDRTDDLRDKMMGRFSKLFENDSTGEEESFHGTLSQALFLMNGPGVNRAMMPAPGSTLRAALDPRASNAEALERLYLAAFARRPTGPEQATAADYLAAQAVSGPARARGWGDLFWAMLTSAEFLVNH